MSHSSPLILATGIAAAVASALAQQPAHAQAAKPLAVQETSVEGVNAEIAEVVRKDGVLTVKVRFRNTGSAPAKVPLMTDFRDADSYYVVAGSTKLMVLKDTKGIPVMSTLSHYGSLSADLKPASSFLMWAKYPAPPAEVKKVNLYTPHGPPFEDLPIAEAK